MRPLVSAVLAAALVLTGSVALAEGRVDGARRHAGEAAFEQADHPASGVPGHQAPEGRGMAMMPMRHGCHMGAEHLAATRAELALTPAQLPLWNRYEAAVKAMTHGDMDMMAHGKPLPDRLKAHEEMMAAHLKALRDTRAALDPLYAALSAEQRATLDRAGCAHKG